MFYVKYLQQTLRESYVYEYEVCSSKRQITCGKYSGRSGSSSCDGAAHELSTLLYYVRYAPRTLSTAAAAAVLHLYAATLRAIACVLFSFQVNYNPSPVFTLQRPFRLKLRERGAHTSRVSPSAFHILFEIMNGAGAVSLSQLLENFPNKRACTYSRRFLLLSLRVMLEYSDFSA